MATVKEGSTKSHRVEDRTVFDGRLMKVSEFAEFLNLKDATIRRWLLLGRVVAVKLGRSIRIPASEGQRLIREGFRPRRSDENR